MNGDQINTKWWFVLSTTLITVVGCWASVQSACSARNSERASASQAAQSQDQINAAKDQVTTMRDQVRALRDQVAVAEKQLQVGQNQAQIAQDQLKVVQTEAELAQQPVLLLDLNAGRLVIRNTGAGLAQNAATADVRSTTATISFHHKAGLGPNQVEPVDLYLQLAGQPASDTPLPQDRIREQLTLLFQPTQSAPINICTMYQDSASKWYEVRQAISFSTAPGLADERGMIIRYVGPPRTLRDSNRACLTRP